MTETRLAFPTEDQLPPGWKLEAVWWSACRGSDAIGYRRVYLNGGGTDDELRFHVFPPGDQWRSRRNRWPACDACKGTGRVRRPEHSRTGFLAKLIERRQLGGGWDEADADGLRRCDALNCSRGQTEPIYGAANSRMRVPGFPADLLQKTGARGMSSPTVEEIIRVMWWCDDMLLKINSRGRDEVYP